MDQSPTRNRYGSPEAVEAAHLVDPEYLRELVPTFSKVAAETLYADRVDVEYALKLAAARSVYDIVILWRRGVAAEYALDYSDRRDLTVLDVADMWEAGIPAEFGALT